MAPFTRKPLPPSLYADTARPPIETPPLGGDHRTAVVIVGGGFTGLSTALHLAEAGTACILLEAHEPGWGASGRNGGQVNPGLKPNYGEVVKAFGPDLGRRMVALSSGAPDFVFSLIRRLNIDCEPRQTGTLRVAFHDNDAASIRRTYEDGRDHGMPFELLDAAALRTATGTTRYVSGVLDPRGGHLNPLGYARGLAEAAQRAGARIHGGTSALRLSQDGRGWRIDTPSGTVRADRVVLGTNGYTDSLWPGLEQTVVPVHSGIVATEPLPDALAAAIMPGRSSLYEIGKVTVYLRLDAGNRLLVGGRSFSRDLAGPEALAYLARYGRRLWPALDGVRWTHGWNGRVAVTTDHYPHVHAPAPGILIGLGYNGRGVAMASAMGAQLARRLQGGPDTPIDMPITGITPIRFHRFWPVGVTARILYGRARDALGL
ncbi:NAD(P)/FAD-dependent oxidoreductase [Muricoccus radiodurans]|uniref:NAD(P)/FAD-dependent oxidoreductase n=1 Tax=Muricoccus radiodurans TaxID=2231721 RepID=UPI003CECAF06